MTDTAKTFTLEIRDATRARWFDGVRSFVGEDASGSFGLKAGHARFVTTLTPGLSRFRTEEGEWQYLAMSAAVLYFAQSRLWIGTRRFLLDRNYDRVSTLLRERLLAEEQVLEDTRLSLRRMEEALMHRMWQLNQELGAGVTRG